MQSMIPGQLQERAQKLMLPAGLGGWQSATARFLMSGDDAPTA
jgi:hypothetical protein